MFDFVLGWSAG